MTIEGTEAFSERWGISAATARSLAEEGRVDAQLIGGSWVFRSSSGPPPAFAGRPLGPKMAWYLRLLLVTKTVPVEVPRQYRARLRAHVEQLDHHPDPALLLRTWFRHRLVPIRFDFAEAGGASPEMLRGLLSDRRFLQTGVSYPFDGLEQDRPSKVEGRCTPLDYRSFITFHRLRESPSGPIWVRRLPNGSHRHDTTRGDALIDLSWHTAAEVHAVVRREVAQVVGEIRDGNVLYLRHPGPR